MRSSPIQPAPAVSLTTSLHSSAYLPLIREEGAEGREEEKVRATLGGRRAQRSKKIQVKRGKLLGTMIPSHT